MYKAGDFKVGDIVEVKMRPKYKNFAPAWDGHVGEIVKIFDNGVCRLKFAEPLERTYDSDLRYLSLDPEDLILFFPEEPDWRL